jgi:hypothetical protein
MSSPTAAPTMISNRPIRRCSSSAIRPPIPAAAEIAVRKPMAMQNSRSVLHHPAIRSVAMTAVAQPLRMLSVAAAMAVVGPGARSEGTTTGVGRGM